MERTESLETTAAAAAAAAAMERSDTVEPDESRAVATDQSVAELSTSTEAAEDAVFADPGAGVGPVSGAEVGSSADVRPGMEVVGFDGESVGLVKEVRESVFLLDRVMRRDVYVPLSAVEKVVLDVTPAQVVLNVRGAEVAVMDWDSPPLT